MRKSVIAFLAVLIVAAVYAETNINFHFADMLSGAAGPDCPNCPNPPPDQTCGVFNNNVVGTKSHVFSDLTATEIYSVLNYVKNTFNTTDEASALTQDYVYLVELQSPTKSEALAYLDQGGSEPRRRASVIIYRGSVPEVLEIIVGDLPNPSYYETVRSVNYNARTIDELEYNLLDSEVIRPFAQSIKTILAESYPGYNYVDCSYDYNCSSIPGCTKCLYVSDSSHRIWNGARQGWQQFFKNVPGFYLQNLGLEILIVHNSTDTSTWRVDQIAYNGFLFNSTQEFIDAYNNNQVIKIRYPTDAEYDPDWSSFNPKGAPPPSNFDKMPPPRNFEPKGHRWQYENPNKVIYGDWSFEYSNRASAGTAIWNAMFKGVRIAYEISLQQTLTAYAAILSPYQSGSIYQDTDWGLGVGFFELKNGIDCPYTAEFYNYTVFNSGKPMIYKNAYCIFEQELGYPFKKHFEQFGKHEDDQYFFYAGQAAYALTLRTSSTISNYDYIFDHIFYPHGVIEVRVSLAGYIQATYSYQYPTNDTSDYNTKVERFTDGSIHDHFLNFKLDLDVDGTNNTFEMINTVVDVRNLPNKAPPSVPQYQKKVVRDYITNEDNSTIIYNFDLPMLLVMTNQESTNKWGVPKGIRISSTSFTKNILAAVDPLQRPFAWSKYQVAVTQYHDNETYVGHFSDQNDPFNYVYNLDDYFNNENLAQADLVCWVTMGMYHLPISEDIPTQPLPGNQMSIFLRPYNLFDDDPSGNQRDVYIKTPAAPQPVYDGRPELVHCTPNDKEIPYDGNSQTA